ncbi:S1C family serine protease [Longispora albida]|uniref:S1C family serine protease n=1 Tax=Longispora albida TaxID=203523 RepID=UPI000375083B|nr:trypsin-like peptidase domain-containing protein [Longispora albida]
MSSDENREREPQATPAEPAAGHAQPETAGPSQAAGTPVTPDVTEVIPAASAAEAISPAEPQAVTPEQLAEAVRHQAERSETLRGDLGPGASEAPAEVARETSPEAPAPDATAVIPPISPVETVPQPGAWVQPPVSPAPAQPGPFGQHGTPGQHGTQTGQFPAVSGPYNQGGPYFPGNPVPPAFQAPKKKSALPKILAGTAAALIIALTAGTVGGVVGFALGDGDVRSPISTSSGRAVTNEESFAGVVDKVQAAVVGVKTPTGSGSGVVFNSSGYILTNNHVIDGAGGQINVTFNDGKTVPAKLVGADASNDLAVLKVDNTDNLTALQFADSDAIKVGDPVLAVGNPLGLEGTVTGGIISAKDRTITEGGGQNSPFERPKQGNRLSGLLQTDAAINSGNSGGALVDAAGRLVGINTAIATSGDSKGNIGVGFAIPSNKAKKVAEQLMKGGKVATPYAGVKVVDSDKGGALVQSVEAGGPAASAGLAQGDVITQVNGKSIKGSAELISRIQSAAPGDKLTLTVDREGKQQTVTITIGEKPN